MQAIIQHHNWETEDLQSLLLKPSQPHMCHIFLHLMSCSNHLRMNGILEKCRTLHQHATYSACEFFCTCTRTSRAGVDLRKVLLNPSKGQKLTKTFCHFSFLFFFNGVLNLLGNRETELWVTGEKDPKPKDSCRYWTYFIVIYIIQTLHLFILNCDLKSVRASHRWF